MADDDQSQDQGQDPQPAAPPPQDQNSSPPEQAQPNVQRALPVDPQTQYEDALQQGMRLRKEQMSADERYTKEAEWAHKQAEQLLSDPMPKMPSFEEAYPQPKPMPTQAAQDKKSRAQTVAAFIGVAIPLALALGGRRRGAAIGAIAGLSQGIQAINEGYDDKAKHAAALWKQQNDMAAKYGKDQMEYYKDIIANRKTNIEEKMQLLNHTAESFKDEAMMKKTEVEQWDGVVKTLTGREKLLQDFMKNKQQNEEKIMRMLGSGAEYEDYKQRLIQKSPSFKKAIESGDSERYFDEYNKASEKYPWQKFLDEKQQMKIKEAKARKEAEAELSPDADSSPTPADDKNLDSMANDLAKKLRGGQ
jgi:hypothetical protein